MQRIEPRGAFQPRGADSAAAGRNALRSDRLRSGSTTTANRDWIQATLAHDETGGVPYNFAFSPPAEQAAKSHYGEELAAALGLPMRMTSPRSIKPLYARPEEFGPTAVDEFGVVWKTNAIDRGSPATPCLSGPSLSEYRFPDPAAPHRFVELEQWCTRNEGHYRVIWVGDLWERATFMRGMEGLLLDVMLNPSFVEELLRRLADRILQTLTILCETCDFEAIALSDDYGTQNGMIISPASWRHLVRPLLAEIYGRARERGRVVLHHSCGDIAPIVGDLIDIGLDILHPIQPEAMDILRLKREFGAHLTFCGGIPTQTLLVSGTPPQVREEVRRLKDNMGRGGGYILEPGITIQADVPLDNIVAMVDAARERSG